MRHALPDQSRWVLAERRMRWFSNSAVMFLWQGKPVANEKAPH